MSLFRKVKAVHKWLVTGEEHRGKTGHLTHSHTMTPFDGPWKQAF